MIRTDFVGFRGESLSLNFSPATPTSITGWAIGFYVSRVGAAAGLGVPLLSLATGGSGVAITNGAAGLFTATITSAQSLTLGAGRYWYDVWRTDAGSEMVIASGELKIFIPARW
jgi:hypothetical protein